VDIEITTPARTVQRFNIIHTLTPSYDKI
jgi:hypothetical protein